LNSKSLEKNETDFINNNRNKNYSSEVYLLASEFLIGFWIFENFLIAFMKMILAVLSHNNCINYFRLLNLSNIQYKVHQ